jgi:hypothetical protein
LEFAAGVFVLDLNPRGKTGSAWKKTTIICSPMTMKIVNESTLKALSDLYMGENIDKS